MTERTTGDDRADRRGQVQRGVHPQTAPADSADVVVIGGGIAGVAAACFAAMAGARVTLLEAEPVLAHHTTGRSAALYLENYGAEPIRRLVLASRPFLAAPPDDLVDVPLLSSRPTLDIAAPGRGELLRTHAERGTALVPGIRLLDPYQAVEICPALRPEAIAGAVLDAGAQDIDVMALHQGFVRGLRRNGGAVRTSSPVVGLTRQDAHWVVTTPTDELRAATVINAAGAWGDRIAELGGVTPVGLRPLHRTAFTVGLPADTVARDWPLVQDLDEGFYFKPEGDGLLCSLADEAPAQPGDAKPRDEDVALALDRINEATTLRLRSVRTAWAGLRTFAPDRLPVIGPDPDVPSFLWVVGLGGFGIMTAPAVGMLAAMGVPGLGGATASAGLGAFGVDPAETAPGRLR